jgi:hypothetical protein
MDFRATLKKIESNADALHDQCMTCSDENENEFGPNIMSNACSDLIDVIFEVRSACNQRDGAYVIGAEEKLGWVKLKLQHEPALLRDSQYKQFYDRTVKLVARAKKAFMDEATRVAQEGFDWRPNETIGEDYYARSLSGGVRKSIRSVLGSR